MLSNSCRYGIRAVIYLASQPESAGNTGIKKISNDLGLPTPFLAKILQELVKQKILDSSKGPHGGFSFKKNPEKITLLDIVKVIDGDSFFTECIMHSGSCGSKEKDKMHCPLHKDYESIREDLTNLFGKRTINDLVIMSKEGELIVL